VGNPYVSRQPARRLPLTRDEYANTIQDLLGVPFDATDPAGLPEDSEWHGFERIGSVLSVSPSHVEKYLAAAEAVLAEAFPEKVPAKFVRRKDAIELRGGPDRAVLTAQGVADKVRVDLWPGSNLEGGRIGPGMALPVAGFYKVRIKLSGLKPQGGRSPHLTFYTVNLDRMLFEKDVIAAEDKPVVVEFTAHLPAGNHNYRLTNDVPGPSNLPRSGRADPRRPFFSIKEGRRPWQIKLTDEAGAPIMPFLILDWVEWEGPIAEPGPTFAQRHYMPEQKGDPAQLREALGRFAERAFRRPATPADVERYARLVEAEMASGEKFEAAVKTGLVAILCSKDYLYLVEGSAGRTRLNDWELASRLSYFLWSTMPDDELFAAARDGTLHRPEVLKVQLARMLHDPKVARFAEAFPRQWLQLRMVGMFPPDKKLYPNYDDYLQRSMVLETTAYFLDQLQAVQEEEGSLLDQTQVLFGSGMAYGHSHGNANLPLVLAGGKALGLKHGRHLDFNLPKIKNYDLATPGNHYAVCSRPVDAQARLANLLLTMANTMGVTVEQFADSTGPMTDLLS